MFLTGSSPADFQRAEKYRSGNNHDELINQVKLLKYRGESPYPIFWEEHCQECGAPDCYLTCSLYEPDNAVGCRRFLFGILMEKDLDCWTGSHADVVFKRWGRFKAKISNLNNNFWTLGFLLQFYLAGDSNNAIEATLEITASPWKAGIPKAGFQLFFRPGLHEIYIPPTELQFLNGSPSAEASLCFNEEPENTIRFFSAHFVKGVLKNDGRLLSLPKLLCTDLDNTVWRGILGETDTFPELLEGVRETLQALKLNRIKVVAISRAKESDAHRHLEKLGINNYFDAVYCNVQSKSAAIKNLLENYNLFSQEVIFVDDDLYEQMEVINNYPEITIIQPDRLPNLAVDPIVTAASTKFCFSQTAQLIVTPPRKFHEIVKPQMIYREPLQEDYLRCWELLQRTNRLNCVEWRPTFSGFIETVQNAQNLARIGICADKSGNYGLVCFGLATLLPDAVKIIALTFSCRTLGRSFPESFIKLFRQDLIKSGTKIFLSNTSSKNADSSADILRDAIVFGIREEKFIFAEVVKKFQ